MFNKQTIFDKSIDFKFFFKINQPKIIFRNAQHFDNRTNYSVSNDELMTNYTTFPHLSQSIKPE